MGEADERQETGTQDKQSAHSPVTRGLHIGLIATWKEIRHGEALRADNWQEGRKSLKGDRRSLGKERVRKRSRKQRGKQHGVFLIKTRWL